LISKIIYPIEALIEPWEYRYFARPALPLSCTSTDTDWHEVCPLKMEVKTMISHSFPIHPPLKSKSHENSGTSSLHPRKKTKRRDLPDALQQLAYLKILNSLGNPH
jgi:hypothetical protein